MNGITESLITLRRKYHGIKGIRWSIHPALYRLNKYDQRTGNELYHTLEVYLQCFHNNKETANILCIHRNSLAYRMEKIIEIGKADLNDPMTEFLLRMSFKLVEYLKIRDLDLP